MALTIEIRQQSGINLTHFANVAEEYFGTVLKQDDQYLNLFFDNHGHAQNFSRMVRPYFASGGCCIL